MPARHLLLALCLIPYWVGIPRVALAQTARSSAEFTDRDAEQSLVAAEAAMQVGDDRKAELLVSRVPPGAFGLPQTARAQLVRAEIALKRGQPMAALQTLPSGSEHVPLYAERIEDLRARALFQLGDPVAAVRSLVLRERYLQPGTRAVYDNQEQIWRGLTRARAVPGNDSRVAVQDEVTRGWLELIAEANLGQAARYDQWLARYPRHPGAKRATNLQVAINAARARGAAAGVAGRSATQAAPGFAPYAGRPVATAIATGSAPAGSQSATATYAAPATPATTTGPGTGVALLVPLSGPFAATGTAVRDGFLNAARQSASGVRIYDSGVSQEQALSAYQTALAEGARVVVGPLQKEAVVALARLGTPTAPVIALNALDVGTVSPSNFLQFGLAPEDEARAAAEQAFAQNKQRAVALVPRSEWGRRVSTAFGDRLRELGGQVVAAETFESGTVDPSQIVSRLMGMDSSNARHQALSNVLGKQTEFDARRRGDVDFIFLAAKPSDSRVILPQLRFFRASSLPLYTTSAIYEGSAINWASIKVCDMPWMLDTQTGWGPTRTATATQYPEPMRLYPRLVALGTDAWRLASLAYAGQLRGDTVVNGASGRLSLGADGRIHRELSCGTPSTIATASAQAALPAPP